MASSVGCGTGRIRCRRSMERKGEDVSRYRPKEGHIELWRRIAGLPTREPHRWWPTQEGRAFTRFEAWIDLLFRASFKAHTRYYKGRRVVLKRGELVTSERDLSSKWKWSRTKLRAFIEDAVKNKEIDHWINRGATFIRIRKLAGYVSFELGDKTTAKTSEKTTIEVPPSSTPPVIVRRAVASDSKPERIGGCVDNFMKKLKRL